MFLKKLKSFFTERKQKVAKIPLLDLNTPISIDFWTAGITYDSRLNNLLDCKIQEKVLLVRESDNQTDTNAIHIKTGNNKSLGYVSKSTAGNLAPLIDNKQLNPIGYITSIQADLGHSTYGVKVSLPVSEQVANSLKRDTLRAIDYVIELSENGNRYILLICNKNTLDEVRALLEANKISVIRTGVSFIPSKSTGKQYRWFINISNDTGTELIEKILRDNFPVLKEKYDNHLNKEYVALQEEDLQNLKARSNEYSETIIERTERIHDLEKALQSSARIEKNLSDQFENMLKIFLNNVIFVRNSTDVLKAEVADFTVALKKIMEINSDPVFRGTKINTLNKWFEIHFNTGVRDDGRIYFKREGNDLSVLVSFKTAQKKDIEYLKGYRAD